MSRDSYCERRLRIAFRNQLRGSVEGIEAMCLGIKIAFLCGRWSLRNTRMEIQVAGPEEGVESMIHALRVSGVGVRKMEAAG